MNWQLSLWMPSYFVISLSTPGLGNQSKSFTRKRYVTAHCTGFSLSFPGTNIHSFTAHHASALPPSIYMVFIHVKKYCVIHVCVRFQLYHPQCAQQRHLVIAPKLFSLLHSLPIVLSFLIPSAQTVLFFQTLHLSITLFEVLIFQILIHLTPLSLKSIRLYFYSLLLLSLSMYFLCQFWFYFWSVSSLLPLLRNPQSLHQNPDGHEMVNLPLSTLFELNKSSLASESSLDQNNPVLNDSPQFLVEDVQAHDPLSFEQNTMLSESSFSFKTSNPPISSFSFPEVPTAGELLMLDLEGNRRYRQAKENLVSTPPTPITFTDL